MIDKLLSVRKSRPGTQVALVSPACHGSSLPPLKQSSRGNAAGFDTLSAWGDIRIFQIEPCVHHFAAFPLPFRRLVTIRLSGRENLNLFALFGRGK